MLGQKRQREVGPLKPIPANPRGNLKPKIATTSSASSTHAQLESDDAATWKARRDMLQAEVDRLVEMEAMQAKDHDSALDAVEQMLSDHARRMDEVRSEMNTAAHQHELAMEAVRAREERCRTRKQQALDSAAVLANSVASLVREHDGLEEELVLQTDVLQQKEESLREAQASTAAEEARLAEHLRAEELASDAGYGLSGEVKEMLDRMAELEKKKKEMELLAMQSELTRRELFAKREELKGSIRVFCRVKGRSTTTSAVMDDGSINNRTSFSSPTTATKPSTAEWLRGQRSPQREASASRGRRQSPSLNASPQRGTDTEASDEGVVADDEDGRRSSTQTTTSLGSERTSTTNTSAVGCGGGVPFSFPASPSSSSMLVQEEGSTMAEKNTIISVHQRRANATSTGTHHSREDFVYDRVFTPDTSQAEVYVDVEPLVHSAVDGYAVCIFAYGQTGSGKTYTMEGQEDATSSEGHGVTPRAMATIFTRMKELGNDGWSFDLSCWFVEVYNDTIRDLCQPPQLYQPESRNNNNAAASSKTASAQGAKTNVPSGPAASYHTIQHNGDRTSITNVRETQIRTLEDFNKVYAQAVLHRSTARTQLNDRSSRSHCVFSLRINGRNDQLRQRSEGVLCLVDLAGSERVNDSGAEGKELKEAININRSLLDLGKCIHAMRGGGVVPWRNSKLTYLLQNYLGAKGGKMLMIVAVSDQPTHVAESINSLRFAARVSETIVGSAVKRVTNY